MRSSRYAYTHMPILSNTGVCRCDRCGFAFTVDDKTHGQIAALQRVHQAQHAQLLALEINEGTAFIAYLPNWANRHQLSQATGSSASIVGSWVNDNWWLVYRVTVASTQSFSWRMLPIGKTDDFSPIVRSIVANVGIGETIISKLAANGWGVIYV